MPTSRHKPKLSFDSLSSLVGLPTCVVETFLADTAGGNYGSTSQRGAGTGSEEARNLNYEGSTASGVRSGRTGATSQLDSGSGTGTGNTGVTGSRSGTTGTGVTGSRTTGGTSGGISEGFRGMNLTHQSGVCSFFQFSFFCCCAEGFGTLLSHISLLLQYDTNHPVVGDSTIVCDTKYYTAVSQKPFGCCSSL